jgi:hypothetical protein
LCNGGETTWAYLSLLLIVAPLSIVVVPLSLASALPASSSLTAVVALNAPKDHDAGDEGHRINVLGAGGTNGLIIASTRAVNELNDAVA